VIFILNKAVFSHSRFWISLARALTAPCSTKPCASRCCSQPWSCATGRTRDTVCQALAMSAELFFTTDWLLDCFFTLSRTCLLLWGDLSPQGLGFFGF